MNYDVVLVSQLTTPIVPLDALTKAYFRVFHDVEDAVIADLLTTAQDVVQSRISRQLLTGTRRMNLRAFPGQPPMYPTYTDVPEGYNVIGTGEDPIQMPYPKLIGVDSIHYIDTYGDEQTFTDFEVDTIGNGVFGTIYPSRGKYWPVVDTLSPVPAWIIYTCGYGSNAEDVPAGLRFAIKNLALYWFENREMSGTVPEHIDRLLDLYRTGQVV